MRQLAREAQLKPITRDTALQLIGNFSGGAVAAARQILRFVREEMIHIDEGVELIHRPEWLLGEFAAGRRIYGDCDDEATLISTLLLSIGIPSRFVVVERNPDLHVYTEAWLDGRWQQMDPRRDRQPEGATVVMMQEV